MRQLQEKNITSPVRYLKGVGPKRAEVLSRIGINTIEDILFYLPYRHEDRSSFKAIKDLEVSEYQTVRAKVISSNVFRTKRGVNIFQLILKDGTGTLCCAWLNQPYLKNVFKIGQDIIIFGKIEKQARLITYHPEYEIVEEDKDSIHIGRIVPAYHLTKDVTARYLRFLAYEAVSEYASELKETLPTYMRARKKIADISFAIRNMHFPNSFENLKKSYHRLVFEEFFLLQTALAIRKNSFKEKSGGIRHDLSVELKSNFKNLFPFKLTKEQEKAMADIEKDISGGKPMNRLLEGEVGSGKTVVAIYALLLTISNGYQGVLMAPTEILARQHFIKMSEILMPLGINVSLLVSGIPEAKKNEIKEKIEKGGINIVCGTHALIQENVKYKKPGLIVIDEQHKFGVAQRKILKNKGINPHVLMMTATPIPRTLAMTVYGDMDISRIKELPEGRQPITTCWAEEERRDFVYDFIKEEVKKGRQVYIVYPRISKRGASGAKAAAPMYNELQDKIFPDLKVALIHGKMSSGEKDKIMRKFKKGDYNILVSTVVIEVGIDIPNASLMVIENAEQFGLAQLHQLRGRIGRGSHDSYCILLGAPSAENAHKRLSTMTETQDGFKIAEEDLKLRGPGEFFGTKQHGLPELRFGNIIKDFEIMEDARMEAFSLIEDDPELKNPRNQSIKEELRKKFTGII